MREKEFLYVGRYTDTDGNYILKIGTTNDLERRRKEHTRTYRKSKAYTMPLDDEFEYLWHLPLSKYNTIRFARLGWLCIGRSGTADVFE